MASRTTTLSDRGRRTVWDTVWDTAGVRWRWIGAVASAATFAGAHNRRPRYRRTVRAVQTLVVAVICLLLLHVAAAGLLDGLSPGWRDPEYAQRVWLFRQRQAESAWRPSIIIIGSSRAAMGVCPAVCESPTDCESTTTSNATSSGGSPWMFNFSLLGAGPLLQDLVVRRMLDDGIRSQWVWLEYWPPFMHADEQWNEWQRVAVDRLSPRDLPWVQDYFDDPAGIGRQVWRQHYAAWWASRLRLMHLVAPEWLPRPHRQDWTWKDVDGWGWKPPPVWPDAAAARARLLPQCQAIYEPLLQRFTPDPRAEQALRHAVRRLQKQGVRVGLIVLPESAQFQRWYPQHVQVQVQQQLTALCGEEGVPLLDTRDWMEEEDFIDGFHLTRPAAARYTQRLLPELVRRAAAWEAWP